MSPELFGLLWKALAETVRMVAVSMVAATVVGIPLGILLVTTAKDGILACAPLNRVVATVVNALRSIPFIILMVAIIPFTRLVAGSSIGTTAAMVPLTIASIPFISSSRTMRANSDSSRRVLLNRTVMSYFFSRSRAVNSRNSEGWIPK